MVLEKVMCGLIRHRLRQVWFSHIYMIKQFLLFCEKITISQKKIENGKHLMMKLKPNRDPEE